MKILLLLECEKDALSRSRRVAAKYLNQIGRRTYLNDLSEKALNLMIKELKEKASRKNSIIIYKISRNTKELLLTIGNKNNFTEEGLFVYKNRSIKVPEKMKLIEEYCLKIIELSALFHDIGKSNIGFQAALKRIINNKEPILNIYRHELVSYYMLNILFFNESELFFNEESLIDNIINKIKSKDKKNYFNYYNEEDFSFEIKKNTKLKKINENSNIYEKWNKYPLLNSILWLVLTHHKMVSLDTDMINKEPTDISDNYLFDFSIYDRSLNLKINKNFSNKDKVENLKSTYEEIIKNLNFKDLNIENLFLKFSKDNVSFLEDDFYNTKILENFIFLKENYSAFIKEFNFIKEDENGFSNSKIPSFLTMVARPSLVYSDYKGSNDKKITYNFKNESYANTKEDSDNKFYYADSLLTHLLKVYKESINSYSIFCKKEISDFKYTSRELVNELNKETDYIEKFYWQKRTSEKLTQLKNKTINDYFFGVIMAGTGCGKTRASLKFINSINNDKFRLTVALGLKTLSCQTKKEYIDEIFNDKKIYEKALNQINLIVGSCLLNLETVDDDKRENFINTDENNLNEDLFNKFNGSTADSTYNEEEDSFSFEYDKQIFIQNKTLDVIAKNNKDKILINKPIVIATIDNIMKAFNQESSDNLRYLMRIISSDFILDEIDDYDTKDLISISCLIYMLGYFGRKVFISSATVTQEIIKTFFDFYQKGVNDNLSTNKSISFAFINENDTLVNTGEGSNLLNIFNDSMTNFTNEAYIKINEKNSYFKKHKIEILDTYLKTEDKNINNFFNKLHNGVKDLHNHNYIDYDGLKISIGFVKFNNIDSSQKYCNYIDQNINDKNHLYYWINYHSNFLSVERFFIENFLDSNMKRKGSNILHDPKGSNIFKTDYFKNIINEAKLKSIQDVTLIISTTNIIEVGRDHDYDWAIIEPSSIKSIVQAIGRVKRHRDINIINKDESYKNIYIFSNFIKEVDENIDYSKMMSFPGIQTDKIIDSKEPTFSVRESLPYLSKNLKIKASLNSVNKYSLYDYKKENLDNKYIFSHEFYMKNIINEDFLKNPSNKYLISDYYFKELNIKDDLDKSYSKFRLLELEKLKQEVYLNSNINNINFMSARNYISNDNSSYKYIPKITNNFYLINKFRKNNNNKIRGYCFNNKNDFENDNLIINENAQSREVKKIYFYSIEKGNQNKFLKRSSQIEFNKIDNKSKYFFKLQENSDIKNLYFDNMFSELIKNFHLNYNKKNVKMSMVEISVYENKQTIQYNLGTGIIK